MKGKKKNKPDLSHLSRKYKLQLLWWKWFSKWKYETAIKFHKEFAKIPQEKKDELAELFWQAMIKKYNLKPLNLFPSITA